MAETTVSEEVTLSEPRKVVADRGGIYRWGSEAELGEEHAITQENLQPAIQKAMFFTGHAHVNLTSIRCVHLLLVAFQMSAVITTYLCGPHHNFI